MTILKVEAGGKLCKARLTKDSFFDYNCPQTLGAIGVEKKLGSKVGLLAIAKTSPVCGLITTIAPVCCFKATSAAFYISRSRVRVISCPDFATLRPNIFVILPVPFISSSIPPHSPLNFFS